MSELKLYRKRIIPEECILLKDDRALYKDNRLLVTAWDTIRPKNDFSHGYSAYFMDKNLKVSRFLRPDDSLLYWYCDIVDFEYKPEENTLIVRDLLADVIIYPDDFVKVMDLDEFEEALDQGSLNLDDVKCALRALSGLLNTIYGGNFNCLTDELMTRIPK